MAIADVSVLRGLERRGRARRISLHARIEGILLSRRPRVTVGEELNVPRAISTDDRGKQRRNGMVDAGGTIGVRWLLEKPRPLSFALLYPLD